MPRIKNQSERNKSKKRRQISIVNIETCTNLRRIVNISTLSSFFLCFVNPINPRLVSNFVFMHKMIVNEISKRLIITGTPKTSQFGEDLIITEV